MLGVGGISAARETAERMFDPLNRHAFVLVPGEPAVSAPWSPQPEAGSEASFHEPRRHGVEELGDLHFCSGEDGTPPNLTRPDTAPPAVRIRRVPVCRSSTRGSRPSDSQTLLLRADRLCR